MPEEFSENFPAACGVKLCTKHDPSLEANPAALWDVLQHCPNVKRHIGGNAAHARHLIHVLKTAGLWKRVRDSEVLRKQRADRRLEHKLAWDKAHRKLLATRRDRYLAATLVRKGLVRPPADPVLKLNDTAILSIDTETTGLSGLDLPAQLGYVLKVDGEIRLERCVVVRYHHIMKGMSEAAQAIHGISSADMQSSPYDAAVEIATLVKLMHEVTAAGGVIIGHNISFDLRMLKQGLPGADLLGLKTLCTLKLAREQSGQKKGLKLERIYSEIVPATERETSLKAHNALSDAKMAIAIYKHRDKMNDIKPVF